MAGSLDGGRLGDGGVAILVLAVHKQVLHMRDDLVWIQLLCRARAMLFDQVLDVQDMSCCSTCHHSLAHLHETAEQVLELAVRRADLDRAIGGESGISSHLGRLWERRVGSCCGGCSAIPGFAHGVAHCCF